MENTYTLLTGKGLASDRLTIVNECYNPLSLNLLNKSDLSGKAILEVACGVGIFSCELARLVGKKGKVIATDVSSDQLNMAKNTAKKQNITNIEFIECSGFELDKLDMKFDYVYSRFLLAHLKMPELVLKQELNCLKKGGYLICAEPPDAFRTMFCYPDSKVFNKIKDAHIFQTKIFNTDFAIGSKLPKILKEFETQLKYTYIFQPILSTPREKSQMRLVLMEIREGLINKGFFTDSEIQKILNDLKEFEKENHIIGYAQCMETCVKK